MPPYSVLGAAMVPSSRRPPRSRRNPTSFMAWAVSSPACTRSQWAKPLKLLPSQCALIAR
ncbi:MAG: hypothetical protein QM704_07390 [Anaeromyxobacteraceae bacterium]